MPEINKTCLECGGECCKWISIPIMFDGIDIQWCKTRGFIDEKFIWRVGARCKFLTDENLCSIYHRRPETCVNYRVDGEMCKNLREAVKKERMKNAVQGETK